MLTPHSQWSLSPGCEKPFQVEPRALLVTVAVASTEDIAAEETQVADSVFGAVVGVGEREEVSGKLRPEGCGEGATTVPRPRSCGGMRSSLLGLLQLAGSTAPRSR